MEVPHPIAIWLIEFYPIAAILASKYFAMDASLETSKFDFGLLVLRKDDDPLLGRLGITGPKRRSRVPQLQEAGLIRCAGRRASLSLTRLFGLDFLLSGMSDRTQSGVIVKCLSCSHKAMLTERDLGRFGVKRGAPIAQFVKRLRCRQCGSASVMATRSQAKSAVA